MEMMLLEVPAVLKPLMPHLEAFFARTAKQVASAEGLAPVVDYQQFEADLRELLAKLEAATHGVTLRALDVDADRVSVDGVEYKRVLKGEVPFQSQAGEVSVERSLFRKVGERNGTTLDLVALRAGAVEGTWLPGTAKAMAYLLQQGTSREAKATARELGRLPYSRSSFERVGHAVGALFLSQRDGVERTLIEELTVPDEASSVSLSLDRVAVPMEEPRPVPPGRPRKDAPRRPISRVYRMGYCGAVTLHDEKGKALHTIRYGTLAAGAPKRLATALVDDALALRAQKPKLAMVLLCDGAPEMWNLLGAELDDDIERTRVLDFYHLVEKLAPAAKAAFGDEEGLRTLAKWKARLLNSDRAPKSILKLLIASGKRDVRVGDTTPVHDAITYLTNHLDKMAYASARSRGLPIGSGAVEATCKTLVAGRMKRAGSRWKTHTGEHVIHLRALALSDRWDRAMALTLKPPRPSLRRVS